MDPFHLAVFALAGSQVVDTWRNGSIFARPRAAVEAHAAAGRRWAELLDCDYCLAHWTPPSLMVLAALSTALPLAGAGSWAMIPVYGLAATRAVLILDATVPPAARHDRGGG